jgi:O-antigen/teichoic acid export membrane protein
MAARDSIEASGLPTREERRELRRIGRLALTTNVAVAIAIRADLFVLERVTTLEVMGAYAVAQRVVDQAFTVIKQISASLVPRLGGRAESRAAVLRFGTLVLGLLTAAPFAALAVVGAPVLVLWAGPAIGQPVLAPVLAWLSMAAAIAALNEVAASALFLGGNPASVARATMCGSALNLIVSVLGAYYFGPSAVAAATLAGNFLVAGMVWYAVAKWQGLSRLDVARLLVYPVSAAAVGCVLAFGLDRVKAPPLVSLLLAASVGTAIVAGLAMLRTTGLRLGRKEAPTT